jgi:topoisomerase-4 subunit A
MRRRIVAEIKKDAAAYGDDRRTLIEEDKPTQLGVKIVDEPVTVIVSEKFWVKTRQGHGHALTVENTQTGFKAGDRLYGAFECRTTDVILAFGGASAAGRVFSVPVSVLPSGRGDGAPLPSLIDLPRGGVVAYALAADAKQSLLIAGERGYGFLTQVSDLQTRQKTGKQFLTLDENEKPLPPMLIDGGHDRIAVLSSDGRLNVFPLVDVKTLSGGRGVQLMALEPEHRLLVASGLSSRQSISLSGPGRGGKVQSVILTPADLQAFQARRGHKGKSLLKEKALKFTPQLLSSIDKKP